MHKIKKNKKIKKEIAKERVKRLLLMANMFHLSNPVLSKRYCRLAEKIRLSVNLRLAKDEKVQYCKKCFTYWVPGKTVKVRVNHANRRVVYKCLLCGHERSFGY